MDVITLLADNHSCFHTAFKDLTCNVGRRLWTEVDIGLLQGCADKTVVHLADGFLDCFPANFSSLFCQNSQCPLANRWRSRRVLDGYNFIAASAGSSSLHDTTGKRSH
jgi:hypothetical protein